MKKHPYISLPDTSFWRRSISRVPYSQVDPVCEFNLRIRPESKIATAGSCFAQHIARHLKQSGYNYYVVEQGHPILSVLVKEKHHYGTFSARYGNIYTARQLLQLFLRAYGEFEPIEDVWEEPDGRVLDPYRPTVQPNGFVSIQEMKADRKQHLLSVRRMFETLDVFVFTLGLTECWRHRADGATFPLCPGVEGGVFDSSKHEFYNQPVADVLADMNEFIGRLKVVNPGANIIVTVSPVPLMATADKGQHVLSATTYSKSVLRVAAGELANQHAHVHYFPSYEIITGNFSRGRYYADDLRDVDEEGVLHVMRLFLKHAAGVELSSKSNASVATSESDFIQNAEAIVAVECDEVALDRKGHD